MPHALTRLELHGFKSFAGKTSFEFPPGITAIVGPNGSGKSNVIDAIRWLLGERDARNLRGGKIEDLVFVGTPERARVGLARATIYFDNSHQFLPVDFEEVSVSREVARTSTNRYFLNKSEVRLKDIIDFFAQARLGSRGFTVVTQGKSDMFIEASPKDRREMVEELLGLKEYQLKKSEAERGLSNARINLEKVEALVEEILPHLRSLKRQTSRWEKREDIEEQLKELENQFFGAQWHTLEKELGRIQEELNAHETSKEKLLKTKQNAEVHLTEIEAAKPKEQQELKELKKVREELFEKRGALEKELGRLEAEQELRSRFEKGSIPQEKLVKTLHRIQELLEGGREADYEALKHAVTQALSEIRSCFQETEGDKRSVSSDSSERDVSLERTERELKDIGQRLAHLEKQENELEGKQEGFYKKFKDALRELESARSALENWERSGQEKILARERLLMRKEELERQINQAGRRVEEFMQLSVEMLSHEAAEKTESRIFRLRGELAAIGEIDKDVVKEAKETAERYEFLQRESKDLRQAEEDLKKLIIELSEKIQSEFTSALVHINKEFQKFFELMFGGGKAKLVMVENASRPPVSESKKEEGEESGEAMPSHEASAGDTGIEIRISLPRKKVNSLDALSGGERALVGIATLFSLISVSPPPFLVLDEVDAALDDRNARRFAQLLREFSKETQFIVVTHNRATMEVADVLYGVTLDEDGTSKVVSMKLGET